MDVQQVPNNEFLQTAHKIYQTTDVSTILKSEKNRTLFAEDFKYLQALPLSTVCLKVIAANYKGSPIKLNIKPIQLRTFYDSLSPDLPLEKCINISDEYYWKRVYSLKCPNKMSLKQKTIQKDICWKNLGVTNKFVELIETTPPEIWIRDEMEGLAKKISPFVTEIKINKLQALRETSFPKRRHFTELETNSVSSIVDSGMENCAIEIERDYSIEHCHHVDLSVLKDLRNLHSLTIEFVPPDLGLNYHSRYFDFSYKDIQNLASGISTLSNLKILKIRRSRMDNIKLSMLLEVLKALFVEHLEFYFCQLDNECGQGLYEFLISNFSVKLLNLSGNYFQDSAVNYLSNGIQQSHSKLMSLSLSNNPISEASLCNLLQVLIGCEDLKHVALSGIETTKKGAISLADMIKWHLVLEKLEIIAVPMDAHSLIAALDNNTKIQYLLCQGCGLSVEEEFKIELLLKRNRYIKDNPYIGDVTKTEEEINDYVSRIKNPILLFGLESVAKRRECRRQNDESPSFNSNIELGNTSHKRTPSQFRYGSKQFTQQDLSQRVTLVAQKNTSFF